MKFKFRYNRRYQTYVTLLACAAGIALMVMRFGLSLEQLLSFLAISLGFLLVIFVISYCFGMLISKIRGPVDIIENLDLNEHVKDNDKNSNVSEQSN